MKTLIESQTLNCKKYKRYSNYSNYIVNHVLRTLDIKKELVQSIDKDSNFLRGIHVYLPNYELFIRLWDVSEENTGIITTRFSVFQDELSF
jgi:hypothetical protein